MTSWRSLERQVEHDRQEWQAENATLDALSYLAAGGDGQHLEPIITHFGQRRLAQIGQHEIDEAAARLKPHAAPSTVNRQIYTPISAVLHHAARKQWCATPVIARPSQPAGRVRWITVDEADRLVDAAAPHLRPLVIFLLSTGARLSEALYLDWSAVDLSRCHVEIRNAAAGGHGTKNDESRGVPLHPRAVAALANLPHRTGPVFRKHLGGMGKFGRVRPIGEGYADRGGAGGGQVKTAWRAMLKRAKVEDFSPHDCRHTWATWHYAANRDLTALMQLGGWKSAEMVLRYAHVNATQHAGSIARLWGDDGAKSVQPPANDAENANAVRA